MAHLAAHAVASNAVAKLGAAGASASAHAGAGGLDAIFAALLAEASGTADATGAAISSKNKGIAELLNGSAILPAAAQAPANQNAADPGAILAAAAAHRAAHAPDPAAMERTAATPKNMKAQAATAQAALPADANAPGPDAKNAPAGTAAPTKDEKSKAATQAAMPATLVASLMASQASQVSQAATPAAHAGSASATPAATATDVLGELTALRTIAQKAQPQASNGAMPPPMAADSAKTMPQPAGATPIASAALGQPQTKGLETALAALQTAAHQARPTADARQAQEKANTPTAQHSAAFAAAAEGASHQTMPLQQAASVLSPTAPIALAPGAQAQSGGTGSGRHESDPKAQDDRASAAPAKPDATMPAAQLQQPSPGPSHSVTPTATSSLAVQTAPAATPIAASLQVAPRNTAPASDQQAIPLGNLGAIAVHIAAQSKDGAKQFNIALHPQDLGSIHVQLSVDHTGAAQAHLSADNQQTLTLLQRDSHLLERALKDAGLNLAGSGLNFSLKGQDRQNGSATQQNGRGRDLSVTAVANTNTPATGAASTYNLAPDHVRLDIRV